MRNLLLSLITLILFTGCVLTENVREVDQDNVFFSKIPKFKIKIDPAMKYIDKPQNVYHHVGCQVHYTYYLFYDNVKQNGALIIVDTIGGNCGYVSDTFRLTREQGRTPNTTAFFAHWNELSFPEEINWIRLSKKLNAKDKFHVLYFEPTNLDWSGIDLRCDQSIEILEPEV